MPITDEDRETAQKFALDLSLTITGTQLHNLARAFAAHRETAYQAGLLAGAKAMQDRIASICFVDLSAIETEYVERAIRDIDPAQIARDTSLSPDGV